MRAGHSDVARDSGRFMWTRRESPCRADPPRAAAAVRWRTLPARRPPRPKGSMKRFLVSIANEDGSTELPDEGVAARQPRRRARRRPAVAELAPHVRRAAQAGLAARGARRREHPHSTGRRRSTAHGPGARACRCSADRRRRALLGPRLGAHAAAAAPSARPLSRHHRRLQARLRAGGAVVRRR